MENSSQVWVHRDHEFGSCRVGVSLKHSRKTPNKQLCVRLRTVQSQMNRGVFCFVVMDENTIMDANVAGGIICWEGLCTVDMVVVDGRRTAVFVSAPSSVSLGVKSSIAFEGVDVRFRKGRGS